MSVKPEEKQADTYLNPVYRHSFPDPFVLRHGGHYFAYATGHAKDRYIFDVLTSTDLVNWTYVGGAMQPLDDPAPFYWAPEVVHFEGKFYLYYSVGNETLMHLRVAVSDRPDRGFTDRGARLTTEDFAIDAHVFVDDDGQRYLFYATDFLEHSHIGTGTVVDRMVDPFTLEGKPKPVTRAKYDWQIYDPARKEKGGVRWHTVEGPAVIKHKGTYFEMYSGGNWQNTSYGVSFATTLDIASSEEWEQYSDGETVLPLIRSVPEKIVGPGHNSIVRGPNGREYYCIYHRWTDAGRVMAIDRMDFVGDRLVVIGPTDTPQPMPYEPAVQGIADVPVTVPASFLCEFVLVPTELSPAINLGNVHHISLSLPTEQFDLTKPHNYRVEVDGSWMSATVDDWFKLSDGMIDGTVDQIELTGVAPGSVSGFSVTHGFEDLFDREAAALEAWTVENGNIQPRQDRVQLSSSGGTAIMSRSIQFDQLEFVANLQGTDAGEFGLALIGDGGTPVFRLAVNNSITITAPEMQREMELPRDWDIGELHRYCVIVKNGRALIYLDEVMVETFSFSQPQLRPAIFTAETVTVETARATAI